MTDTVSSALIVSHWQIMFRIVSVACLFSVIVVISHWLHAATVSGDVAPYNNPDGLLDAGDLIVVMQFLNGFKTPTAQEVLICDVAPLGNINSVLDIGDYLVLQQAVLGLITLDPIDQLSPPQLWGSASTTDSSPYYVSGLTDPNSIVNLYRDGVYHKSVTANRNGLFNLNAELVEGNLHSLYVTAAQGGVESDASTSLMVILLVKPASADLNLIAISNNSADTTITGQVGSVAANSTVIINLADGTNVTAQADQNGGFTISTSLVNVASIAVDTGSGKLSDPAIVTAVGSIAGTFDVDPSGTATYSIPISVPPGTAGMAPSLSLKFSSRGGNGTIGRGWSLGGLSVITRCSQTIAQDGSPGGVSLDANDRFCLDGQRLISVNGAYGADLTEYRTEVESFIKVVSHGGTGISPAWFQAWTKSGQLIRYGFNPDSGFNPGGGDILLWSADRVEDKAGNYFTLSYSGDTATDGHFPVRVDYTGNDAAGLVAYNNVQFVYEARPDTSSGYIGGQTITNTQRLSNIRVYDGANVVRDYRLSYDISPATEISRLRSIIECDSIALGATCLLATEFTWSNGTPDYMTGTTSGSTNAGYANTQVVDVNGDGMQDLVVPHGGYWWINYGGTSGLLSEVNTNILTTGSYLGKVLTIDYNSDGMMDLLVPKTGNNWDLIQSGKNGFKLISSLFQRDGYNNSPTVIDLDGDGRQDLMLPAYSSSASYPTYHLYQNTMSGFGAGLDTRVIQMSYREHVIDYDNDGVPNLLLPVNPQYTACSWWSLNRVGQEFTYEYTGNSAGCFQTAVGNNSFLGDINGDGLLDLATNGADIASQNTPWGFTLNTGRGFEVNLTDTGFSSINWQYAHPTDYNNDGRTDIIFPSSGVWHVYQSTGNGFQSIDTTLSSAGYNTKTYLMDVNGDGMQDIVSAYGGKWYTHLRSGVRPDRLESITNGMGVSSSVSYKSLTDSTVYTKGSSAIFPEQDFQQPMYVVSQASVDDGAGNQYLTDYTYTDAKVHLQGRGLLGFGSVTSIDQQTGIVTTTTYRQDFPFIGMPLHSETLLDGQSISTTDNIYSEVSDINGAVGVHFPYANQSTERSYELPVNGAMGAHIKTVTTTSSYDNYGNPTSIQVETASTTGDVHSKLTTNTYDPPDLTNWLLDRVSRTSVLHTAPNTVPITKTSGFSYYPSGLLHEEIIEPDATSNSPLYLKTAYEYDSFGNKTKVTVAGLKGYDAASGTESRTTETQYDSRGQFPLWTKNARLHQESYVHDARFGTKTSLMGPNGLTTTWAYDSFGRKVRETRADGTESSWAYDFCNSTDCPNGGFIETVTASGSSPVRQYHDALQRVIRSESVGLTGQTVYQDTAYDSRGNVTRKSRPYFSGGQDYSTQFQFDVLNRPTQETAPDGGRVDYVYTELARNTTRSHTSGDYAAQTDTRTNDVVNQLAHIVDAMGGAKYYAYDASGNLVSVSDTIDPAQGSVVTTTGYDLRGRKTSMDDPDMGHWEYKYNTFGELVWQKNAKDQVVTMAYDQLGRMTSRTEPEGASSWTYDVGNQATGKLTFVNNGANGHTKSLTYDNFGRLASETSGIDVESFTSSYTYDGFSRRETVTYPTGFIVRNVYNQQGHLTEVKDAANDSSYWQATAEDAEGHVTAETLGNGLQTLRGYEPTNGTVTSISTGVGAIATVQDLAYGFDALGNLKQRQDYLQTNTENFVYDGLNRLNSADIVGVGTRTYAYDAKGNILNKSDFGDAYTYGAGNAGPHAVTEVKNGAASQAIYSYDANGNMTGGDGRTLVWTSFNKAASISQGSTTVAFGYDAGHDRIKQVSGSKTTYYLNAGAHYEKEIDGGTTAHKHFISAGGRNVAIFTQKSDNTEKTRYLHTDHLGSTDVITDENKQVVERQSFSPFGSRRNTDWSSPTGVLAGIETHHGFTGHEHLDSVGIIHMNGRLYDPKLGRFLSPDIQVQYPDQTQSFNRYTYVNNNPLSFTDPSGYGFFSKLWKSIKAVFKSPKALFSIAVGFLTGFATWAALGYGGGFVWGGTAMIAGLSAAAGAVVSTLIMTNGDIGAALKAGLISGLTAFAGSQIMTGINDFLNGKGRLYNVEPVRGSGNSDFAIMPANSESVIDRLFVNGMKNDLHRAAQLGFDQLGQESFTLFHNPSHGFIADLTESALGKLFGRSNLSKQLAGILQKNPGLAVTAHSQGGVIVTNALEHLASQGIQLEGLSLTLNGSAVAERVVRAAVESVGGKLVAFNTHPLDAVTNIVGLNTLNPVKVLGSILTSPFLFTSNSQHVVSYAR